MTLIVDRHHAGVREVGICRAHGVELYAELLRCPSVVVVEEGDPLASRSRDAGVPRRRHATGDVAADHADARLAQLLQLFRRVVGRAVVDHDHLVLDALL